MFEEQLRNIDIGAILIALMFLGEFDDLEVSAADNVSYFQKLRRLALVNRVKRKCSANP